MPPYMLLYPPGEGCKYRERQHVKMLGTALGTLIAPSYANLLMGKLEREFLWTRDKVPLVWWSYVDDVFLVWTHGE